MTKRYFTLLFAYNLQDKMREKWMSQRELAEMTGLTEACISDYINRKRLPGILPLVNMANALGCTPDELAWFGEDIY